MEKYGVEEVTDDAKKASENECCPYCEEVLEKEANVKKCPKCGVEPFQGDPDD